MRYISFFDWHCKCVIAHNLFFSRPYRQLLPFFWLQLRCSKFQPCGCLSPGCGTGLEWEERGRYRAAFGIWRKPLGLYFIAAGCRVSDGTLPRTYPCFHFRTPTLRCSTRRMNNCRQMLAFLLLFICASWWYFTGGFFNHLDLFFFLQFSSLWSVLLEMALKAEDAGCLPASPIPPLPPRHQIFLFIISSLWSQKKRTCLSN